MKSLVTQLWKRVSNLLRLVQVVGHSLVQDKRLLEYQQKVLALTGEFKGVFVERISREDNARADRLANEAIDEELQIVDNLSEYIDQEWSHTCAGQSALPSNLHIKPVASVSPHVVKVHGTTANSKAAKTRNESPQKPSRSRCFVQEETSQADIKPQSRPHYVQAAAHSILCQKHARLRMSGKSTLPNSVTTTDTNLPTSTSALDEQMDGLSFSDESVGDSQIGLQASDQSSTLEDIYLPSDPRFELVSDSTDDSLSESEAESARLVREILSRYKAKTIWSLQCSIPHTSCKITTTLTWVLYHHDLVRCANGARTCDRMSWQRCAWWEKVGEEAFAAEWMLQSTSYFLLELIIWSHCWSCCILIPPFSQQWSFVHFTHKVRIMHQFDRRGGNDSVGYLQ